MATFPGGFQVDNLLFPITRKRLNEILLSLVTLHYSESDPPSPVPFMMQLTTIAGKLKARVRNAANNGWEYDVFGGSNVPAGSGMDYFGTVLPDGWLWRDGEKYTIASQPDLYAAIGTTWNTGGEAPGEFRVPNDGRKVTVGPGQGFAFGSSGGQANIAIGTANLPNYILPTVDSRHGHQIRLGVGTPGSTGTTAIVTGKFSSSTNDQTVSILDTSDSNISVRSGGSGVQLSIVQPYIVCNKIIKA